MKWIVKSRSGGRVEEEEGDGLCAVLGKIVNKKRSQLISFPAFFSRSSLGQYNYKGIKIKMDEQMWILAVTIIAPSDPHSTIQPFICPFV
jgi:hypothetical protein